MIFRQGFILISLSNLLAALPHLQEVVTATLRREPTVDFQSSPAAGLQGLTDREVLALAAQQGRILVTHDRKTMPTQFADDIEYARL